MVSGIPPSLISFPESKAQHSGLNKKKFPGFRNSDSLTWNGTSHSWEATLALHQHGRGIKDSGNENFLNLSTPGSKKDGGDCRLEPTDF